MGVALLNLVLSVSLTAALGLEGVTIGTTGAFAIAMPFYLSYVARRRGLSLGVFAGRVWVVIYGLAAILAAALLAASFVFSVDSGPAVAVSSWPDRSCTGRRSTSSSWTGRSARSSA